MSNKLAIRFANEELILDGSGSIYWPTENILLIADMHLEKGSFLAQHGHPLPLFDTADTLSRIDNLILRYQPKKIISVGDNIHDPNAFTRMHKKDLKQIEKIARKVQEWHWLIGNHDKQEPDHPTINSFITFSTKLHIKQITLTHDLIKNVSYQIVGHYHPKANVSLKATVISGKCFALSSTKIFLPAFGSYTGGLDIASPSFAKAAGKEKYQYYFLYDEKIWQIT